MYRKHRTSGRKHTLIMVGLVLFAVADVFLFWKAWNFVKELRARSSAYDSIILEAARRNGADPNLIKAVIWRESRFRADARGKAGEVGLMQIMPDKAAVDWARAQNIPTPPPGTLFTPAVNIEIGAWYLGNAMRRWSPYKDGLILALCEYNAGISRANSWKPADPNGDVRPRIAISSTLSYVNAILGKYAEYKKENQFQESSKQRRKP